MARHLIQNAATGETHIVGDSALPFFPGFVKLDTYDDGIPPAVFYGAGEADLRYVNVTELSDPASAASVALRAAFGSRNPVIANVEKDGDGNWLSWTEDGVAHSATYDPATGDITSLTVANVTRTFSYVNGELVGAA